MNPFALAIRRAKTFLCCASIASIYGACLLILPAKAEHCLLPKRTISRPSVGYSPSYRNSSACHMGSTSPGSMDLRKDNVGKVTPGRSVIVPGCLLEPQESKVPGLNSEENSPKSRSLEYQAEKSIDTISPILKGFCEYALTEKMTHINGSSDLRSGSLGLNAPNLVSLISYYYPHSEVLQAYRFTLENFRKCTVFELKHDGKSQAIPGLHGLSLRSEASNSVYIANYFISPDWIANEKFSVSAFGGVLTGTRTIDLANVGTGDKVTLKYEVSGVKKKFGLEPGELF